MELRAVLHYITVSLEDDGFMNQDLTDFEREEVHGNKKIVLKVITLEEGVKHLAGIVQNMFASKVVVSECEDTFIKFMFDDYGDMVDVTDIPFKENMARYINIRYRNKYIDEKALSFCKTATDVYYSKLL